MIALGDKVQDIVTGFTGIAISKVEYLNGCVQFCVKPRLDKDRKDVKAQYIDIDQLKKVRGGLNVAKKKTGGPSANPPPDRYGH